MKLTVGMIINCAILIFAIFSMCAALYYDIKDEPEKATQHKVDALLSFAVLSLSVKDLSE